MEKSKPRGNILSLEVYQCVGDEIIGQQPHHTEGHELKQDGPYFGVKPEGYLFSCRAVPEAFHFLSKGRLLPEEVSYGNSSEDKLLCLWTSCLPMNSDSKGECPGSGALRTEDYLNGKEYMSPPLDHRSLRPRSSLSGVLGPTLRSKTSA